jgi:hypothetical protein
MAALAAFVVFAGLGCLQVNSRYVKPIIIQEDLLGDRITPVFELPVRDVEGDGRMWETSWSYDVGRQGEAFLGTRYGCRLDQPNTLICARCRFIRASICFLEQKVDESGYYRTVTVEQGRLVIGEGFAPNPRGGS